MGNAAEPIHGYFGENSLARDFSYLIIGDRLGRGITREVYKSALDNSVVLKFEIGEGYFQNTAEWLVWQSVQYMNLAKWFAPCVSISPNGVVLIMKKTTPVIGDLPKEMPAFLNDFKRENFGMYEGRIVCHDYGSALGVIIGKGVTSRMKKVDWTE